MIRLPLCYTHLSDKGRKGLIFFTESCGIVAFKKNFNSKMEKVLSV